MPGLDFATLTFALPLWGAGAVVTLFLVVCGIAFRRSGSGAFSALVSIFIVVSGVSVVWLVLDRMGTQDRAAERNALDARFAQLAAYASAPGSPLACLDAMAGEAVADACEKMLFASPASVAAAVAYTSARLALLADGVEYTSRNEGSYERALAGLRHGLENDRFGFLAHILAVRDSCTNLQCDAFVLFRDVSRVQANLNGHTYDGYVARYAANWAASDMRPESEMVAATPAPAPTPAKQNMEGAGAPVSSRYNFPSAASIPPVSIMNAEPSGPPQASPPPAAAAQPPALPRRSQTNNRPTQSRSQSSAAANQSPPPVNRPLPLQAQPQPEDTQEPPPAR